MRLLSVPLCVLSFLLIPMAPVSTCGDEPEPTWEGRVRKVLEEGDRARLQQLAAEYRKLPPATRRELPVRVREDSVEFAFRGVFAGDRFQPEMLEYLLSDVGKDYESLLVVIGEEFERAQALRTIFEKRAGEGRRKWWSARLVWTDEQAPQSVDLSDLLILLKTPERNQFLDQLAINSSGLGGSTNVAADPACLPKKRVFALLLLTIRIASSE